MASSTVATCKTFDRYITRLEERRASVSSSRQLGGRTMSEGDPNGGGQPSTPAEGAKKWIFLNAFDMSAVSHLSPGQWKIRSSTPKAPNLRERARADHQRACNSDPEIYLQPNESSITGSTWLSFWNAEALTCCFSPTRTEDTIPIREASTNASNEQRHGQSPIRLS